MTQKYKSKGKFKGVKSKSLLQTITAHINEDKLTTSQIYKLYPQINKTSIDRCIWDIGGNPNQEEFKPVIKKKGLNLSEVDSNQYPWMN